MPDLTAVHVQAARVALDAARRDIHRDDEYAHQSLATIAVAEALLALVELLGPPSITSVVLGQQLGELAEAFRRETSMPCPRCGSPLSIGSDPESCGCTWGKS